MIGEADKMLCVKDVECPRGLECVTNHTWSPLFGNARNQSHCICSSYYAWRGENCEMFSAESYFVISLMSFELLLAIKLLLLSLRDLRRFIIGKKKSRYLLRAQFRVVFLNLALVCMNICHIINTANPGKNVEINGSRFAVAHIPLRVFLAIALSLTVISASHTSLVWIKTVKNRNNSNTSSDTREFEKRLSKIIMVMEVIIVIILGVSLVVNEVIPTFVVVSCFGLPALILLYRGNRYFQNLVLEAKTAALNAQATEVNANANVNQQSSQESSQTNSTKSVKPKRLLLLSSISSKRMMKQLSTSFRSTPTTSVSTRTLDDDLSVTQPVSATIDILCRSVALIKETTKMCLVAGLFMFTTGLTFLIIDFAGYAYVPVFYISLPNKDFIGLNLYLLFILIFYFSIWVGAFALTRYMNIRGDHLLNKNTLVNTRTALRENFEPVPAVLHENVNEESSNNQIAQAKAKATFAKHIENAKTHPFSESFTSVGSVINVNQSSAELFTSGKQWKNCKGWMEYSPSPGVVLYVNMKTNEVSYDPPILSDGAALEKDNDNNDENYDDEGREKNGP